jgi:hypothetical protein
VPRSPPTADWVVIRPVSPPVSNPPGSAACLIASVYIKFLIRENPRSNRDLGVSDTQWSFVGNHLAGAMPVEQERQEYVREISHVPLLSIKYTLRALYHQQPPRRVARDLVDN